MGKTKLVASSECFMFTPTDNQASGVKRCVHEAYRVSLSVAERHKSTTSTSSSSILPTPSACLAASIPHIFVKTCWMPAALEWLVSTEHFAGAVPVVIDGVDVGVEVLADIDAEVDVDVELDMDAEVNVGAEVDVDAKVDVHAEVDVMVK